MNHSVLYFSFSSPLSFLVCLQDSVLAFWKHGMQGKSFKSDEVRSRGPHPKGTQTWEGGREATEGDSL